ncbi:Asp23/Gls24 family envelope stress response protein [Phytoactinopolyspora limicola]|uniref:Asp23/Gls24 family envelope stress response protein n=1 Tax=Phytoactinopolyspora limicola TaxID=2715536 RepID=UPI001A9C5A90|nr:Asp23/Gls24 family envelope stress response protein [Phytoactinopolyspora limicola]
MNPAEPAGTSPSSAGRPGASRPDEASVADAVAEAVLAVDGVASLYQGLFGEVGSYLPGRRVPGVRLHDGSTEVHVIVAWGAPVPPTADAVRRAVTAVRPGDVDVMVADVAARGAETPQARNRPGQGSDEGEEGTS